MNRRPTSGWVIALQVGLIGGAAVLLIALVGMFEEFSQRDIIAGVIEMGQALLFITLVGTGYYAAHRTRGAGALGVARAGLAGLVTSAMALVLILITDPLDLRVVLPNASPALINILTFGQGIGVGGILALLGVGLLVGAIGGLIYWLPGRIRGAVVIGLLLVALIGLLQDQLRVILTAFPGTARALAWMFGKQGQKGLSIPGAIVVFIVVAGVRYLYSRYGSEVHDRVQALPPVRQRLVYGGLLGLLVLALVGWPWVAGPYWSEVTNSVGLFIMMGLGLNIVVGFAGLLDLGYVAFFAIGAYVMGVLTTLGGELAWAPHLSFWLVLPVGVVVSVLFGVVLGIPVLKMRGDYLAIVTLGFGEIIRIMALSDFLKPYIGGSRGIVAVGRGSIGNIVFDHPQTLYYMVMAGCLLALFISWRLRDSRLGRTWKAMREDEDVAEAMGINLVATKLLAFGTGAAFSGLSGAIFASKVGTIDPHSFNLLISINVLSLIIVGGMGSLPGVFVGALILVGLPELLREFAEYRQLMFGALLIVMMLVRPEGFWPEATRQRELEESRAAEPVASAVTTPAP
jgi:branched-chain amino acid transport system permease protein